MSQSLILRIAGVLGLYDPRSTVPTVEASAQDDQAKSPARTAALVTSIEARPRRTLGDKLRAGDVPRNNLGWPTIEPAYFTLQQLLDEAEYWRPTAVGAPGCVGDSEFKSYANELVRRGYLDEIDLRAWRLNGPPRFTYKAPNPDFPDQKKWVPEFPANRDRTQRREW